MDAQDPCPRGYRVPTKTELQHLLDNTVFSSEGDWTGFTEQNQYTDQQNAIDNKKFDARAIFTSKRRSDVKLTIPAQGWYTTKKPKGGATFPFVAQQLKFRASFGYLWSSTANGHRDVVLQFTKNSVRVLQRENRPANKTMGMNIRCIAQ